MSGRRATYGALLRAVNVSGRNRVPMAELRDVLREHGHPDAKTYLQSGNVVLESTHPPDVLASHLETLIEGAFGVATSVFVRSAGELATVVSANPWRSLVGREEHLHVTFLREEPSPDLLARLETPASSVDELRVAGREVFLWCPGGYGRTKLDNKFVERRLGQPSTTRNWKTVRALASLTAGSVAPIP